MINKAEELIACRKTQRNACAVVETLEMALPGMLSSTWFIDIDVDHVRKEVIHGW